MNDSPLMSAGFPSARHPSLDTSDAPPHKAYNTTILHDTLA
jgi:hypothetical protein